MEEITELTRCITRVKRVIITLPVADYPFNYVLDEWSSSSKKSKN